MNTLTALRYLIFLNKKSAIENAHKYNETYTELPSFTKLKAQKMLYFAQATSLLFYNKALFNEDFEAWDMGPVIPTLYKEVNEILGNKIDLNEIFNDNNADFSELSQDEKNILWFAFSKYGKYTALELSRLTHEQKPWINAYKLGKNSIIGKNEISSFLKEEYDNEIDNLRVLNGFN